MKNILITLLLLSNFAIAETTIYLVRHAEKVTTKGVKNPKLTQIGQFRAKNIANQLSSVGITRVFSTDYKRTLQTAQPMAELMNIKVESYDPSQLENFAKKLINMDGKILVVGHSNTTPFLTRLISGQDVSDIDENEYDNLYQIIIRDDKTILNRFKTVPASRPQDQKSSR